MGRRSFLCALGGALAAASANARQQRPNVLFIAADDLNTGLGCFGHPLVKSPHIDRLAARGVRFERAYCQFPLCGPSRASLLTGLRPDSTGVLGNDVDFRDHRPEAVTLPQLFKQNGYYAGRVGKMFHMNVPGGASSDKYQDAASWTYSLSPGGLEMKSQGETHKLTEQGDGVAMRWIRTADGRGQSDTNAADKAVALLEERRNEPFFLGVGFLRPHLPFVAPGRYYDMYPLDSMRLAEYPPNDLDDIPEASKKVRSHLWNQMGMDAAGQRESLRGYYASTTFMDDQVGRVLDALERMKLASNTIVMFWGDHGWNLGEHSRWQKMSLMEDSARAPLIVAAPGRKGNGSASRSLVEFVDIYPTLAELCGLKPPPGLEGQSLAPLLDNPRRPFKRAAFTQLQFEKKIQGWSIRTEHHRYIRWQGEGGGEELYDHRSDPGEFTNLVRNPKHEATLRQMRKTMDAGWKAARAS